MGLLNLLKTGRWTEQAGEPGAQDLRLSVSKPQGESTVAAAIREVKRQPVAVAGYKHGMSNRGWPINSAGDYMGSMYNLAEIGKALDVDGYFAASVRRHRELIMKEGWKFSGKNKEAVEYVRRRMHEIEMISGEPMGCTIREGLTNLVAFATCTIVLKRDINRSSGGPIRMFGKTLEPISGLYIADPSTMAVKKNDFGRPVEWKQKVSGQDSKERKFRYHDVVLMTLDKKSGFTFGTPYVIPVLDDIRALRRLEELVEIVTHKNTFPFFHVQVGSENKPAGYVTNPDGTQFAEVELIRNQIDAMPPEGILVTSERVEIIMLGQEGKVLDLTPYLAHFENRVLGGLRLSGIDLGRGDTANRATAQTVTKNLIDAGTEIQNVFTEIWNAKINDILLLEGGFDLDDENRVKLIFPNIDREEIRAHQNHGTQLFMNNLITEDEYREDYLGREPMTDEERMKTNFELYTKKMAIISAVDEPFTAEAKASSRAVANKSQPANQFGVATTKKRIPANDDLDERRTNYEVADRYYSMNSYYWNEIMRELQNNSGVTIRNQKILPKHLHIKNVLRGYTELMMGDAKKFLTPEIERGYSQACRDIKTEFNMVKSTIDNFFTEYVRRDLIRINRKAMIMLNLDVDSGKRHGSTQTKFDIAGVFNALDIEVKNACIKHTDLAYKVGYLDALAKNDCSEVEIVPDKHAAPNDWVDKGPRTISVSKINKYDFTNPGIDKCYLVIASQTEVGNEGDSDE